MSIEFFSVGLLIVATLTSLLVEAVKKVFAELGWKFYANITACICAAIISVAVCIIAQASIAQYVALIGLSWVCSMVGYDKVMQAITQIKNKE